MTMTNFDLYYLIMYIMCFSFSDYGGHLASIHNGMENAAIFLNTESTFPAWIGLILV